MIAVLAGRRVDAADAPVARFPLKNVEKVKEKLQRLFTANNIDYLVSSGACGADLIALDVAGHLDISRKMVLPFGAETFRSSSVTDRPGNWGELFDTIHEELKKQSNVITLKYTQDDDEAYEKTNFDILNTADILFEKSNDAGDEKKVAIIIWEGAPKDSNDTTDHFRKEAGKRGYQIEEINSLH